MSEYLRRILCPTPFERALMVGATIPEAFVEARAHGGGISFRAFHLTPAASEMLEKGGWAPAVGTARKERSGA